MPGQVLTKRCPSSLHVGERELPIEEFSRQRNRKDGRRAWCKRCISAQYHLDKSKQQARSKRWYAKNGDAFKGKLRTRYATDTEYREKVKKESAKWARENPELAREAQREWSRKNRDHINQKNRERYAANIEELRAYNKAYRAANVEKFAEYNRRYWQANPDVARAAKHRRRTRELAAPGNVTKDQLRARWDYYNGKCWMCGKEATQMDHVKPVSKGGGSWATNLRPACQPCNSSKSDQWPFPTSVISSLWSSD